ncbi:EamA family transporter [Actinomadura barringtoniae]|uniref:EamA family transporter n=1 Tax=Actinomadura barringtoniae TaxID=1427535 RepID=A0A939PMU5_9ACTN|nr:EamA family transporter [Actinomadura barringtoniae]MBO2451471.1 EamA family transporter [Actinomadura barringtoniae]
MSPRHVLLAVLIAAIWGFNFVPIKVGLEAFPPLLFASLRFVVSALPAVFFIRRPPVAWKWILMIGLAIGVGQFGLLFIGMRQGMPAGLSSVVLQTSALFTVLIAAGLLRERPRPAQLAGMAVAFTGVTLIGVDFGHGSPILAFLLCIGAAASWGLGNVLMRKMNQSTDEPVDAFGFMVWMSLVPPIPMLALSLIFEGPSQDWHAVTHIPLSGATSLLYIAYLSTLVGFGTWGWLMRRYEAGTVAMYSLLVPPFGIVAAVVVLNEHVSALRLFAAALIVGGVALGSLRRRAVTAPDPLVPAPAPAPAK